MIAYLHDHVELILVISLTALHGTAEFPLALAKLLILSPLVQFQVVLHATPLPPVPAA